MASLDIWETGFRQKIQGLEPAERQKAGALLSVVPRRLEWDDFLVVVKAEWWSWRCSLERYPNCLLALFGGLAFYEYDENTFWPPLASAVGSDPLPPNRQNEIGSSFLSSAKYLGLKIYEGGYRNSYVGSAIYQIGIPLSLWDGFLEICEWALWRNDWKALSDEEWTEAVGKRTGGRQRLKRFLIENREAASAFVQEMLDARKILIEDKSLTIADLSQACILRPEYFEEVPETADFLRPENPDSLFQDRAGLVWEEQRSRVSIYLPGVAQDKLPATWSVGAHVHPAAAVPDKLILNSAAFDTSLHLELRSGEQNETQKLGGLKPWGLFDEKGALTNTDRQQLPIRGYVLVAPERLDRISRSGFDETENPANESFELEDGSTCFVTKLWPTGKAATLSVSHGGVERKLHFRTSSKIEARFFVGEGKLAANFSRVGDILKVERLPLLCVAIPLGYFKNTETILRNQFQVCIDNEKAAVTHGEWEKRYQDEDEEREFYFWKWADMPLTKTIQHRTLSSFKELNPQDYNPPDVTGKRVISIKAPELGVKFEYQIELLKPKPGMRECWQNLPGAFLPWFLLCQSPEGMRWNDLMLARDAIAPRLRLSYYSLKRYGDRGLLKRRGRTWVIAESRATLESLANGECQMQYCGDPSLLWGLYRYVLEFRPNLNLPAIQVVEKRGQMPFLLMRWKDKEHAKLKRYLENHHVRIVSNLWRS